IVPPPRCAVLGSRQEHVVRCVRLPSMRAADHGSTRLPSPPMRPAVHLPERTTLSISSRGGARSMRCREPTKAAGTRSALLAAFLKPPPEGPPPRVDALANFGGAIARWRGAGWAGARRHRRTLCSVRGNGQATLRRRRAPKGGNGRPAPAH